MSVFYKHPLPLPLGEVDEQRRTERGNQVQDPLSRLRRQLSQRESQGGCTTARKMVRISLASPFGRGGRAKRGRRGEIRVQYPLSRLRRQLSQRESQGGVPRHEKWRASPLPLPLGEVDERSEDGEGRPGAKPSQSPTATALPKGEPRGCSFHFSSAGKLV